MGSSLTADLFACIAKALSYFCVTVVCNTTNSARFFSFILHNVVMMTWELCDDLWNLYASVVWMVDLTWRIACG